MPRIKAVATEESAPPMPLQLVSPADIYNRMHQLSDSIARRAFEIFERNGRIFGRDLDDWLQAESELLQPVRIEMAESPKDLIVRAEVPGFTAKDLEVCLEPHRLTITGKRETKEEHRDDKTSHTEHFWENVLRVVDLPLAVDAEKATGTIQDGVLEIKMPKAAPDAKIQIESKLA